MSRLIVLLALVLTASGCATGYSLVSPGSASVASGALRVQPAHAWNRAPKTASDVAGQERWTQNGPVLDSIVFLTGLKDGSAMIRQALKETRKVPVFRSNMTPDDFVAMLESYYRIAAGATVFEVEGVKPTTFVGTQGMQVDFDYVGPDEVKRRGRSVLAIADSKLYMMSLEAAAMHYFDAAAGDFDSLVASAARK